MAPPLSPSLSPLVVPSLPSRPELAPLILFSVCPVFAAAATRSLPSPSPDPPFLGATNGLSRPIARRQHEPAREPQPRPTSGNFHHINILLGTNIKSKLSQEHQKVQIQALIQKKNRIQGQVYLH